MVDILCELIVIASTQSKINYAIVPSWKRLVECKNRLLTVKRQRNPSSACTLSRLTPTSADVMASSDW